ncbi:hypothetical protein BDQ17DRAFT_892226 [Cyathus striatus]|nr:hypothetical protein BDQ17DRAFT_892226 [Cyathus striatus]
MFRLFSKYNDNMEIYDTLKCNEEEIDCFIESISIVDQYELPSSPDDISNVLIYSTWESHKKSIPENTIPKKIPITWNDPEGMYRDGPDRKTLSADYHSGSFCDICQEQNGPFYTCLVCTGTVSHCQGFFDLCGKCQKENTHILNHQPEHAMYKHYKDHSLNIRMWTNGIASYFLSNQYLERQRFPEGVTCGQCRTNIPRTETWYQCMESTCSVMYVCQKCADKNGDFNDLPKIMPSDQNHYWWHTMLFLPGQVASETPNDSSVSLNKVEVVESDPLFRDLSATDVNRINEEILEIKERLGHMELVLERLCKVIEVIEEKL